MGDPEASVAAADQCVTTSDGQHSSSPATASGNGLNAIAFETTEPAGVPGSKFPGDATLLHSYLIARHAACESPDDVAIRRVIMRDTKMTSHDLLDSLLRAATTV